MNEISRMSFGFHSVMFVVLEDTDLQLNI